MPVSLTFLRPLASLAALAAVLLLGSPPPARAEPPPGAAGWLFDPTAVAGVDLTLPPASLEALAAVPDEYVPGTFSVQGTGGDIGPLEVGIRLKGSGGSFRPLTGKSAFKVKFDEYVDDQTLLGLKKLTLNNMVQDPSMMHETLSYEAFRAAGVPASRTGYAFVSVNGADYGLYLNVETLDKVSLPRWFGSTRHLYEGGYLDDVKPGGAGDFEVDEGKKSNRDDLEALIVAANDDSGDWSDAVAPYADLDEMTRAWAVERYLGHWDGYAGMLINYQPNNYYLHSEDSGLFTTLPWGVDQTWEVRIRLDAPGGRLLNSCLGDASCAEMYREAVRLARSTVAGLDVPGRIAEIGAAIRPWQLADSRREVSMTGIDEAVARLRAFVRDRPGDVARWLGEAPSVTPDLGVPAPGAAPSPPLAQGPPVVDLKRRKAVRRAAKRRRKCRRLPAKHGPKRLGSVKWRRWPRTTPRSSFSSTATRSPTGPSSRCPSR